LHNELLSAYRPLVDTPELFLEFARLADNGGLDEELGTDKNAAAALGWAETYGVLGLTPRPRIEPGIVKAKDTTFGILDPEDFLDGSKHRTAEGTIESILQIEAPFAAFSHRVGGIGYSRARNPRGGEKDTVQRFAYEAWVANVALRLYEAAAADEEPDTETIRRIWKLMPSFAAGSKPPNTEKAVKSWALRWVANTAQSRIGGNVYPLLYQTKEGFDEGYGFESLLGAMWLQMMWLLTAGNNVRKCEGPGCDKVITFGRPELPKEDPGTKKNARGAYKTRVDKRFCSHNCLVKKRYHDKKRQDEQSA
jgi:hypothetical protein